MALQHSTRDECDISLLPGTTYKYVVKRKKYDLKEYNILALTVYDSIYLLDASNIADELDVYASISLSLFLSLSLLLYYTTNHTIVCPMLFTHFFVVNLDMFVPGIKTQTAC